MTNPMTLVIATRNKGKVAEIRKILRNFPIEIKDIGDFGKIPTVVEDGTSFDDNAYKKASFTSKILGMPALADDSGLVVEALNGAPGVHSARYAGEHATDEENCAKLLDAMKNKTNRQATFKCVISVAVPTGAALTYEACCEGEIAQVPTGENGFGYDPIFLYPPLKKTFAELSMEEKSRVSHRGKALKELWEEFDEVLIWIQQQMPADKKFVCAEGIK